MLVHALCSPCEFLGVCVFVFSPMERCGKLCIVVDVVQCRRCCECCRYCVTLWISGVGCADNGNGHVAFRYRTATADETSVSFLCSWDNSTYFPCSGNGSSGRANDEGGVAVVPSGSTSPGGGTTDATASSNASWTRWINNVRPSTGGVRGGGDVEVAVCPDNGGGASTDGVGVSLATPIAIECRVAVTNSSLPVSASISAMVLWVCSSAVHMWDCFLYPLFTCGYVFIFIDNPRCAQS